MNNKHLFRFLIQTILISTIYSFLLFLNVFKLSYYAGVINLISVTSIFIISGLILFFKLPDREPIAWRFLVMTTVQTISILSFLLSYIYTNQSFRLIMNGLIFSLIHFVFQTVFLIRIQKN